MNHTLIQKNENFEGSPETEPEPLFPVPFEKGDLIGEDRYLITDKLAVTNASEVYTGYDQFSGQKTALKFYRDESPEAYIRNSHERELIQELDSPHIISPIEVGEHEQDGVFRRYLATAEAPYGTLRNYVANDEEQANRAIGYLLGTAKGVEALHDSMVVHQDIKPRNIFITEGGAVIGDLGTAVSSPILDSEKLAADSKHSGQEGSREARIARILNQAINRKGTILGTVGFMPPEKERKGKVDERGDIYALGATAVYLFTNEIPKVTPRIFDEFSRSYTGERRIEPDRVFVPPFIPREIRDSVYACMEEDPANRPKIDELISAFEAKAQLN